MGGASYFKENDLVAMIPKVAPQRQVHELFRLFWPVQSDDTAPKGEYPFN
jgi:hypothetical protein